MSRTFAVIAAIAALTPISVPAKGDTVRIVITGGDLREPIEIRDPKVAGSFNVWTGPGTSSNQVQWLNVDSRGIAQPPHDLPVYTVSFVTTRTNPGAYTVQYAFDSATGQGYVYVPGKGDPEYRDNTFLILRGVEGNWFHASSEWEKLVNPWIVKIRAK